MKHRTLMLAAVAAALAGVSAPASAQETKVEPGQAINPVDLPQAREIIAKHVAAIGGEAAIRAKKSRHAKGTIQVVGMDEPGTIEMYSAAPNKALYVVRLPVVGMNMFGYDGDTPWAINRNQGPQVLRNDPMGERIKEQANFFASLYPDSLYTSMETIEKTMFEGRDAWRVRLQTPSGMTIDHFFDVETGLLAGTEELREMAAGQPPIAVVNVVSEYRDFDGVKIATKNVQRVMGGETVTTLETVEFDKVSDDVFELPREIEAQMPTRPARPRSEGQPEPK